MMSALHSKCKVTQKVGSSILPARMSYCIILFGFLECFYSCPRRVVVDSSFCKFAITNKWNNPSCPGSILPSLEYNGYAHVMHILYFFTPCTSFLASWTIVRSLPKSVTWTPLF